MGIHIKLQIEIDDVEDVQLIHALESLLKVSGVVSKSSTEAAVPTKPAPRRRKPPKPRFADGPPEERWSRLVESLPERAQHFVQLVESAHPDVLSQSEVIEALQLSSAKAIGGITGSITRWATVDAIPLPWVREEQNGERTWRWIGMKAAQHGLDKPMPELNALSLDDYRQLSERLYGFLAVVHDATQIEAKRVAEALDLKNKAALTGLESALRRWVPTRGLPLPISIEGQGDDRFYRWLAGKASK